MGNRQHDQLSKRAEHLSDEDPGEQPAVAKPLDNIDGGGTSLSAAVDTILISSC